MKLDLGTLSNVIKHGDKLVDLLRGGNTMQTVDRLRQLLRSDAHGVRHLNELMSALDGMEQNLRVFKMAELDIKTGED